MGHTDNETLRTLDMMEEICQFSYTDISQSAINMTKKLVKDLIGVSIAGQNSPHLHRVVQFADEQFAHGSASIYGTQKKLSPVGASLVNGTTGHGFDFDDTYDSNPTHTSAATIPAAFAIGEEVEASGKDLIRAITLGIDVHCRLIRACDNPGHQTGWHRTATLGTFGGTIASGLLLDLSPEEMTYAMGIAYSQVAGNSQVYREKVLTKRFQPGRASSNAVTAALLASQGFTASEDPLFGSYGFFDVYEPENSFNGAFDQFGKPFHIEDISLKPYPSCRYTHSTIDAGLWFKDNTNIPINAVKRFLIEHHSSTHPIVCEPQNKIYSPGSLVEMQFNSPYALAVTLKYGRPKLENFFMDSSPTIPTKCLNKIDTKVTDSFDEFNDPQLATRVTATLANGQTYSKLIRYPLGHPNNRMSQKSVNEKFEECISFGPSEIAKENITNFFNSLHSLEKSSNVRDVHEVLID